ncbi:hypothetical protein [Stenotrophomonas muris]|uniref:hypothetical protein n=1 Tax=Stenotrophomonas muris TaxID=2963283 RepID=UPI00383A0369
MPAIYFVDGPNDGEIVFGETLGALKIPLGYSASFWSSRINKGWQTAKYAIFVHDTVAPADRERFAAKGCAELLRQHPELDYC